MFSVYGMQGQLFRGSMEQLRQVGGVDALTRARRVLAAGQEGRDALAESSGAFVESEANKLAVLRWALTNPAAARCRPIPTRVRAAPRASP